MISLAKIKLLPAREQVASSIRKAILSREFLEGTELTLEGTAKALGVSTTPVREAFQILAADGLIKLRPNKGAIVLGINEKTIRDHYQVREILEAEAVRLFSENKKSTEELEKIFALGLEAFNSSSSNEYTYCNQAFHMTIWKGSGNDKLVSLLSNMWNGLSMGHKVTTEEYAKISISEHQKILEYLKNKDTEKAVSAMKAHISRSLENILTNSSKE
ncbi:MAG: GntR family transcriptional regulator [Spirochaetales bacterium]|nr:GntR family transcriptional regulator [Spirochaetales bacterium]